MGCENFEEEDEDVVIQGSALHEHLSKLGYTDFESVILNRTTDKRENSFTNFNLLDAVKSIFKRLYPIYSWTLQEDAISREQLRTILSSKSLLDDHSSAVQGFLNNFQRESWRSTLKEFLLISAFVAASVYFYLYTDYKVPTSTVASSILCATICMKYSRRKAKNSLQHVVSLQNQLHDLCKKGLKILRYGYRIKLNRGKGTQQFYELAADKLTYLPPLMENLVKFLEHAPSIYYQTSLILVKLLPSGLLDSDPLTRFEDEAFRIRGEINYQSLMESYHVYILVQSEMLHLLALAYNAYSWQRFYSNIPEEILMHIVQKLIKHLAQHKDKLSNIIASYYDHKSEPATYKHKIPVASKWHDLYIHLYLTSNKLQLSYNHVLSILQDIDNTVNESQNDEEMIETTMQKLNDAYKEIDAARNFAEFSTLLLAKTRLKNRGTDRLEPDASNTEAQVDLPRVTSQEPEIMDEVFEEYIKEEYLKPLYEEDNAGPQSSKWDKFLAKNFMAELKEALVDKKKSMAERESKALQRMYKNILQDTDAKVKCTSVPPPPPMPPFLFSEQVRLMKIANGEIPEDTISPSKHKNSSKGKRMEFLGDSEDECEVPFLPLPKMELEPLRMGFPAPPPFLQEESFVGSGENSEEELVESENEEENEEEVEQNPS